MSDTITPIPGKHYRTRDGSRYRCYAVDAGHEYPAHGAVFTNNRWYPCTHTLLGFSRVGATDQPWDLIAEWTEPMVPWSQCDGWVKWQAMNANGEVVGFGDKPSSFVSEWVVDAATGGRLYFPYDFVTHRPSDWRKSLIERPTA